MALNLPDELWQQIFLAAVDTDILGHWLPTSMAESAWFKNMFGEWALRPPHEAVNMIQRRSYFTKKSIMLTCKRFSTLGAEFLFHSLFFDSPAKMCILCGNIDAHSSLGWWTKRLHITRFYSTDSQSNSAAELQSNLAKLLLHLPNLETFIVDWSLGNAFGPVADALMSTCRKSLKTLSIHVPCEALAKVIWTLTALPNLIAVHIEFDTPRPDSAAIDDDEFHLGAANNIHFSLAKLQQLSLKGYLPHFLEQAIGWSFPVLTSLSLHSFQQLNEHVTTFLTIQGNSLLFLDIFCPQTPSLDVSGLLELCPSLRTLAFNPDWRPVNGQNDSNVTRFNSIVNAPHSHITTIGLHGLQYAFGAASLNLSSNPLDIDPLDIASVNAHLTLRANENNFSALTKRWFPRLERIRVLDRSVLRHLRESELLDLETDYSGRLSDLEKVDVAERYDSWCSRCYEIGVRLEDCTGGLLGVLPIDEDEEDEDDYSEESDESGDEYSDEEGVWMYSDEDEVGEHTSELRRLIQECREMERSRGDLVYIPPDIAQAMMDREDEEFSMPMIMVTGPGS